MHAGLAMKRLIAGVLAALVAGAPSLAVGQQQSSVAKLKQVNGNVLVSRESGMATGAEAQPLLNGSRVITTGNSSVVVVFDNGCEVRLGPNERFEIDIQQPCALMKPVALGVPPPAPPVAFADPGLILPVGIGAVLLGPRDSSSGTPVSPN
jgi:hypothetical protein